VSLNKPKSRFCRKAGPVSLVAPEGFAPVRLAKSIARPDLAGYSIAKGAKRLASVSRPGRPP
jgi:hypothetical protein